MEDLVTQLSTAYAGKRVFVTGHTGFKGAWLCEWLLDLGAEVGGLSLEPPTNPALFDQLGLAKRIDHHIGDIRNASLVTKTVEAFAPEYVFHLAAQPLVRYSYQAPVETFETNVVGTANLLEAVRQSGRACSVVVITTDKCYENLEEGRPFIENDRLGGHDPYSASKAAAEIVVSSYRNSYFLDSEVAIASARAGNVIGGGDWALDRIVPDAMRALQCGDPIAVRNPSAVRPFQHVLDPLFGYLLLGSALKDSPQTRSAFNFGPENESHCTVEQLINHTLQHWPGQWVDKSQSKALHEAKLLKLSVEKARKVLGWRPVWDLPDAIKHTVEWYRQNHEHPSEIIPFTRSQIQAYVKSARNLLNQPV